MNISLRLNGTPVDVDVPPHWTLLRTLRDRLGQTDVKHGCGEGVCGACTVLLDGVAVNGCLVLAVQADGGDIETVASLADGGMLHPLQQELVERGAVQCGFCTPGMVLGALEATRIGAAGDRAEIRRSLAGNLCRCTGYTTIVDAVEAYQQRVANEVSP